MRPDINLAYAAVVLIAVPVMHFTISFPINFSGLTLLGYSKNVVNLEKFMGNLIVKFRYSFFLKVLHSIWELYNKIICIRHHACGTKLTRYVTHGERV